MTTELTDFDIVNFLILDGDAPVAVPYGISIQQFFCFLFVFYFVFFFFFFFFFFFRFTKANFSVLHLLKKAIGIINFVKRFLYFIIN